MDLARLEEKLQELPLYEYAFLPTEELVFTERVRHICRQECPMYNKSWACPPAVGTVEECEARCRQYPHFLLISTITEISDIANVQEALDTRGDHEDITRQVRDLLREEGVEPYVLSTEACAFCKKCSWPEAPCAHPDKMFPCVESHGILVTDLAEKRGLDFLSGSNLVTWYSLIFYR